MDQGRARGGLHSQFFRRLTDISGPLAVEILFAGIAVLVGLKLVQPDFSELKPLTTQPSRFDILVGQECSEVKVQQVVTYLAKSTDLRIATDVPCPMDVYFQAYDFKFDPPGGYGCLRSTNVGNSNYGWIHVEPTELCEPPETQPNTIDRFPGTIKPKPGEILQTENITLSFELIQNRRGSIRVAAGQEWRYKFPSMEFWGTVEKSTSSTFVVLGDTGTSYISEEYGRLNLWSEPEGAPPERVLTFRPESGNQTQRRNAFIGAILLGAGVSLFLTGLATAVANIVRMTATRDAATPRDQPLRDLNDDQAPVSQVDVEKNR